jgi:hypothetical protein
MPFGTDDCPYMARRNKSVTWVVVSCQLSAVSYQLETPQKTLFPEAEG